MNIAVIFLFCHQYCTFLLYVCYVLLFAFIALMLLVGWLVKN